MDELERLRKSNAELREAADLLAELALGYVDILRERFPNEEVPAEVTALRQRATAAYRTALANATKAES